MVWGRGQGLWTLVSSSSKPVTWLRVLEEESPLFFIKLWICLSQQWGLPRPKREHSWIWQKRGSDQAPLLPCYQEAGSATQRASSNQYEMGWQVGEQQLVSERFKHSEVFQSWTITPTAKDFQLLLHLLLDGLVLVAWWRRKPGRSSRPFHPQLPKQHGSKNSFI